MVENQGTFEVPSAMAENDESPPVVRIANGG